MKKNIAFSLGLLGALLTSTTWAQNIKSIEFRTGKQLDMGAISELAISFDQGSGSAVWCGLSIRWGDGQEQTIRIGDDQFKTSPAIVPHTYTRAGNFRVDVEGRPMVRGLRSAAGCDGRPAPLDVTVVDKQAQAEAQRQQAEQARLEAERRQQAEQERVRAEQEKQRAEQARLEAERRQREFAEKELELKRRELQMKEEMLKREEEMRRRQQAAPAPAAAPRPAPAAPSAPPAVKPADGF